MLKMIARVALLLLAGSTVACTNPIVGEWEADDPPNLTCSGFSFEGSFEVDDNLEGEGQLHVWFADNTCTECDFDLEVTDEGGGDYELELDFDNCVSFGGSDKLNIDCELKDDELDCDTDDWFSGTYSEWKLKD